MGRSWRGAADMSALAGWGRPEVADSQSGVVPPQSEMGTELGRRGEALEAEGEEDGDEGDGEDEGRGDGGSAVGGLAYAGEDDEVDEGDDGEEGGDECAETFGADESNDAEKDECEAN